MDQAELGSSKHGDGTFVPISVRIVDYDHKNNNVLVRGSSAFGAKNFAISNLISAIKNDTNYSGISGANGITLSANPMVIDFCLIGFVPGHKDDRIVSAEMSWFTSTPPVLNGGAGPYPAYIPSSIAANPGLMVYWPVQAIGGTAPTTTGGTWPVSPASSIGAADNGFDFAGLVPAIRLALTNQASSLPGWPAAAASIQGAIIYVHCDSGVNRTGAAVAAYLMNYGSNVAAFGVQSGPASPYTLQQAQQAANSAPPGNDTQPPGGCDIPVTQAYCNYQATGQLDTALVSQCVPLSSSQ